MSPETAVLDWNRHATNALMNATATATPPGNPPGAGQSPPVAASHLAMVQGAVYDAVNMIDGGYEPYLADLPPASANASKANAVARAAHDVLVGLGRAPVPALPQVTIDWLDAAYDDLSLSDTDPGVLAGAAAAEAMLDARRATAVTCRIRSKSELTPASGVRLSQEASTTVLRPQRRAVPARGRVAARTRACTRSRAAHTRRSTTK